MRKCPSIVIIYARLFFILLHNFKMFSTDCLFSNVSNFYARKDVFITGASGFMGKVLLEKLLRSCPNVNKIFLLIRCKRGISAKERLEKLLETPIFDAVKQRNEMILNKIILIEGDVSKPGLNLSEENKKQLKSVSIVFHSAATVKFHEPLDYAINMNIKGTEEILKLCYTMKELEAFVYISTAYSNSELFEIEEKVYPTTIDLPNLYKKIDSLDEQGLNDLKTELIGKKPNLYVFTKALAENVVAQHKYKLPIAIVRPSIVAAAYKEPIIGWIENMNAGTGIILSIGKGLLRTMMLEYNCIADIIPVDLSINLIICTGWKLSQFKKNQLLVYNCTSGLQNPLLWGKYIQSSEEFFKKTPLESAVWYPKIIMQTNKNKHNIYDIFLHILPAYVVDAVLKMMGRQPRLMKAQKQIDAAMNALEYFTTNQWKFHTENMTNLWEEISSTDKKIFFFDIKSIDWREYMELYCLGIRKYYLKEEEKTIPDSRKKMSKLKTMNKILNIILLIIFIIAAIFGTKLLFKTGVAILSIIFCLFSSVLSFVF